jgi:hypothetical protein
MVQQRDVFAHLPQRADTGLSIPSHRKSHRLRCYHDVDLIKLERRLKFDASLRQLKVELRQDWHSRPSNKNGTPARGMDPAAVRKHTG